MPVLSLLRSIYVRLPVASETKSRLKKGFFTLARPLVADSREYRTWRAASSQQPEPSGPEFQPSDPLPLPVQDQAGQEAPAYGWDDYLSIVEHIARSHRTAIESFVPTAPPMLGESFDDLAARRLSFASAKSPPQVSLVIPVFNEFEVTLECLHSVRRFTGWASYEVILVDDASTDERVKDLARVPGLRYFRNESNQGFLRSCNRAVSLARGRAVVILNSDVQVTRGWLETLVRTLDSAPEIGAVAPKLLYPNGRLQEAGARIRPDGSAVLVGVGDDPGLPAFNRRRDVPYASGACLAVRRQLFEEVGGFDPAYAPAYFEDVDLCFRLREKGFRVVFEPRSVVVHHLSKTTASVASDFKVACINRNRERLASRWQREIDALNRVRIIAFYLPQFHPIPENDLWWGRGFTDWVNVAKAEPNFAGHEQPHLPADLGFYDLRMTGVIEQQAALARRYGLEGFCFYYYNFDGHRLLEGPLDQWIEQGRRGMPFCLCWANETWTQHWDGRTGTPLIRQDYSPEASRTVIRDLLRYLRHPDYIRVGGKPLLLVYRIGELPDPSALAATWREVCRAEGVPEIYLAFVETFAEAISFVEPATIGFDASVEFPPHRVSMPIETPEPVMNPRFGGVVSDYRQIAAYYATRRPAGFTRFRSAMPRWDNTPRQQNQPYVFANSSPGAFQAWLEALIEQTLDQNCGDERIIFINAWNEWAEGAHLEPDTRFGHGYLEAVRNALDRAFVARGPEP